MTDNEKVKLIRKTLKMTLIEFADRIGITNPAVSMIEHNKNGVSGAVRKSIIREFGVSEKWWNEEKGPMFAPTTPEEEISDFLGEILKDDNDFRRRLVSVLARLSPKEWELLEKRIMEIAGEMENASP